MSRQCMDFYEHFNLKQTPFTRLCPLLVFTTMDFFVTNCMHYRNYFNFENETIEM